MEGAGAATRLTAHIEGRHSDPRGGAAKQRIGLLPGEGVGPELTGAVRAVLEALPPAPGVELELLEGPDAAHSSRAGAMSEEAASFCRDLFAGGGAVLAGPHGGRWVYEMRSRFDLFCKLSPLRSELAGRTTSAPFDVIVVREQAAGIYQGRWAETDVRRDGHVAEHSFSYSRRETARIVAVAAAIAAGRSGRIAAIVKDGGIPSVSALWRQVAGELCSELELEVLDIDYAVYRLAADPASFDVIVAPNLFGDILCDLGGALLGSRGMCFGASFDSARAAVYQTNHGAAYDLAGTDRANPAAHLLAAAMLLRESFALDEHAARIERGLVETFAAGLLPDDLAGGRGRGAILANLTEAIAGRVGTDARTGSPGR
jgi:3-isopropylmalate dehydrogenase